jgi:hypothetical protein
MGNSLVPFVGGLNIRTGRAKLQRRQILLQFVNGQGRATGLPASRRFTAKRPLEGAVPDALDVLLPAPGTVAAMAPVTAMTPTATPAARTPAAMAPIAAMPPAAIAATAMPAAAPTAAVVDLHGVSRHLVLNPRRSGRNRCGLRGHANQCTGSDRNREQILPHEQILRLSLLSYGG